ncbi:MAG: hypothetical protein HYZ69_03160, partial [Candidatus Colwellbacteria bacterium]|nr:hypothetical protein [Candidatus Colwellbacteria bacterium]
MKPKRYFGEFGHYSTDHPMGGWGFGSEELRPLVRKTQGEQRFLLQAPE